MKQIVFVSFTNDGIELPINEAAAALVDVDPIRYPSPMFKGSITLHTSLLEA